MYFLRCPLAGTKEATERGLFDLFPMAAGLDGLPVALGGVLDGRIAGDCLDGFGVVAAALAGQHVLLAVGRLVAGYVGAADVADGAFLVSVYRNLLCPGCRILNPDVFIVCDPALLGRGV